MTTPCYIIKASSVLERARHISELGRRAGVTFIMAFKANAVWRTFPLIAPWVEGYTASSLNELRMGLQTLPGAGAHVYCPVYDAETFAYADRHAGHITFNSLGQWEKYRDRMRASAGLRVNPHVSLVDTDIYNPSLPGSRFGVGAEQLPRELPGLEGMHVHALCEADAEGSVRLLEAVEEQFGPWLPGLKWLNLGGGHLVTRRGYDTERLVDALRAFRSRHPHLQVFLEPGSAWMWQTGDLVTRVLDIVESDGIRTAIIDASFTCHMPDTLEMPYMPEVAESTPHGRYEYRLGGNSCLSGDWKGMWRFECPLEPGMLLTFKDMNHYTTVKTTMFNGINHPDIVLEHEDGRREVLRHFTYDDYMSRMS